jgi:hypothetical protein
MNISVKMTVDKPCKGSIRFASQDDMAAITNVYVSRAVPGINEAKEITVTLTVGASVPVAAPVLAAPAATSPEDKALLAALGK